MLYLILIILTQGMQWCHWWCCWYHVMPMLALMVSHEQKKSCCTSFQSSWPKNGVVPFTRHLASCDANTDANSVYDWKSHLAPHFYCLDLGNGVMPLVTPLASCVTDANTSVNTWPKRSGCTSFKLFLPKECDGTIDDAVGIVWHWCQCQWHQMAKRPFCT